jgi:hypothetical protein
MHASTFRPERRQASRWAVVALVTAPAMVLAIQQPDVLSVNDPRPLSAAIKLVEERCHCAISYEDPIWQPHEVIDISGSISHRADIKPRIPIGGRFAFSMDTDLSSLTGGQLRRTVEQLLRTFEGSNSGPGQFQLMSRGLMLHVVPKSGSVLDVPVTIGLGTRRIVDVITTTLNQVSVASGHKSEIATGPIGLLNGRIQFEAQKEPAYAVLDRALLASGRRLSWQLFYDVTFGQYYLNVHVVR